MNPTTACCVIVVAETDKLNRLASSAVDKLGTRLRLGRAVKAEAKRFAAKLAADPRPLHVEVLDVVGFCTPEKDRGCSATETELEIYATTANPT